MRAAIHTTHDATVGTRYPSGGRSPKRRSSPYADDWMYTWPVSAPTTSTVATAAGTASARMLVPGAPATAVTPATATAPGTIARTAVRVATPVTARARAPAAQPVQLPMVATQRTASLRPATASPTARPPTTATRSQTTRAAHSVTTPQSVRRPSAGAATLVGTPEDLSTATREGERVAAPRDPSLAGGLE